MRISLIVAVSENWVIGRDGGLPWHLSSDLRRFKRLTMGHHIIMGRKTFESIGQLLPGRTTIIVTRQPDYVVPGGFVAKGIDEALTFPREDDEVFVIGGAEIYRLALPYVDRIYLTRVHTRAEGDTTFPELDLTQWKIAEQCHQPVGAKDDFAYTFQVLDRLMQPSQP
jgi:dihydrofolate reductase